MMKTIVLQLLVFVVFAISLICGVLPPCCEGTDPCNPAVCSTFPCWADAPNPSAGGLSMGLDHVHRGFSWLARSV
jgi:hypothetical protein